MNKEFTIKTVESYKDELVDIAQKIWNNPETAYNESYASKLQREYLEGKGFAIKSVEGIPTAFIAEFGGGKPVIGFMGEFDALAGLSQEAAAERKAIKEGAPGHGCGHNLLGTGSLAAALSVKELLSKYGISGTVRYYGCPAEEELSGKVLMARKGVFSDLECAFSWHPFDMNIPFYAGASAMYSAKFRFKGVPAHAAQSPHLGRSALDAVELMNVGVNYLREHVKESIRMHYIITDGGEKPNIVPAFAENWFFIRGPKAIDIKEVFERIRKVAEGAAHMTETEMTYETLCGGYDYMANRNLTAAIEENMKLVGPPEYNAGDYDFAEKIVATISRQQRTSIIRGMGGEMSLVEKALHDEIGRVNQNNLTVSGSFDLGDVSYIVPTAQLGAAAWPLGTPAHTWQSCAASGSSMGYASMIMAAKVLAATAFDVLTKDALLKNSWAEFKSETEGKEYKSLMDA